MSNSLWPRGLQHTRPPCSSPIPGAYSNSCPSHQQCHPTISSSVVPCSSCPQSFPESESFPMSQFFISGGQSIGASASASVLPMNIGNRFPLGLISFRMDWLDLLAVQGTLKRLFQHHHSKASILQHSAFFYSPTLTSIHDYLAIVNSAAMNTGVHISLKVFSRYIPRTAGSYGNSFWGTSVWFSMVAEPIYIPTNSVGGFPSLNILSSICYL